MDNSHFYLDVFLKILGLLATPISAYLVYRFTKINMQNETKARLQRYKHDKKYEAYMAFWGLLSYLSERENQHSILTWEEQRESKERKYYFRLSAGEKFIKQLNTVFYEKGFGLYLDKESKELFFKCRNIIYGVLLTERKNSLDRVVLKDVKLAESVYKIHEDLLSILKYEMDIEKVLEIKN